MPAQNLPSNNISKGGNFAGVNPSPALHWGATDMAEYPGKPVHAAKAAGVLPSHALHWGATGVAEYPGKPVHSACLGISVRPLP